MSVETIIVEKNGKYGPMVNGEYYSFSKFYKGEKEFMEGQELSVDIYTSATGKKYINSLVETVAKPKAAKTPSRVKEEAPKTEKVDSKPDWDAISKGKVRSLFVEALLSNPNVLQSIEPLDMEKVKAVIEPLVTYVFGGK